MLCDDIRGILAANQILPFMWIIAHVVQLFRAIGVTYVAPSFGSDTVVVLIVGCHGGPFAGGLGVPELVAEAEPI